MIALSPLPESALLARYRQGGHYTDCFSIDVSATVTLAEYVVAFYTTAVFKLERLILRWAIDRPSTDTQAHELAHGTRDQFAAWDVEARAPDQLLLRDLHGRTCSWLMTQPRDDGGTRLYFGSAVVTAPGARRPDFHFRALLGFHRLYSKVLLHSAARRLGAKAAFERAG